MERAINIDLSIGRYMFGRLFALGLEQIAIDYIVVDTIRVPRDTFGTIIEAWRDGYAGAIGELTSISQESAIAYFDAMIANIHDPMRYAVWMVPVASARVPLPATREGATNEQFAPLENLQVSQVNTPLPAGYVRVEIEAGVSTAATRASASGHSSQVTLPWILGRDFAGRAIQGPDSAIGIKVWGSGGGILGMTQDGSPAEHMLLPLDAAIARPSHLTAQAAAVTGVPFVAAWSALVELAQFQVGGWVVVSGAGGSVGSAAIALANALGGHAVAMDLSSVDPVRRCTA